MYFFSAHCNPQMYKLDLVDIYEIGFLKGDFNQVVGFCATIGVPCDAPFISGSSLSNCAAVYPDTEQSEMEGSHSCTFSNSIEQDDKTLTPSIYSN